MNRVWGLALAAIVGVGSTASAQDNELAAVVEPAAKRERTSSGSLSVGLMGRRLNDEVINSGFGRGTIMFEFSTAYRDWLKGKFSAGQAYTTGTASNLYAVSEGGASSTFAFIDEASIAATPLNDERWETRLIAGVVPVKQNPILSVMWNANSWATARAELENKGADGKITFGAQQSIPSTRDISNRIADEDVLPLYTNASLTGELKILDTGWTASASAAHFVFTDLASSAAADSVKTGSSVTGLGKTAFFDYEYRGMEYAGSLKHKAASGDTWTISATTLTNELAPSGNGRMAGVSYKRVGDRWDWTTSLNAFRLESDAIPSVYMNPGNGFTNREGATVSLKADNTKEKFSFAGSYSRANVLDQTKQAVRDGYQADRDTFTLSAEVKHDIF